MHSQQELQQQPTKKKPKVSASQEPKQTQNTKPNAMKQTQITSYFQNKHLFQFIYEQVISLHKQIQSKVSILKNDKNNEKARNQSKIKEQLIQIEQLNNRLLQFEVQLSQNYIDQYPPEDYCNENAIKLIKEKLLKLENISFIMPPFFQQQDKPIFLDLIKTSDYQSEYVIKKNLLINIDKYSTFRHHGDWPILNDRYQILSMIGKGGYSEVYKAYDYGRQIYVACKIHQIEENIKFTLKAQYKSYIQRENEVLIKFQHDNIVRFYDQINISTEIICTVLELCDIDNLSDHLKKQKKFKEKDIKIILFQILQALKYVHSRKVIHFDLKPQNILFLHGKVRITDFGICELIPMNSNSLTFTPQGQGTYHYLPPEYFTTQETKLTTKLDVWSFGVIAFELVFGFKPFCKYIPLDLIRKDNLIQQEASKLKIEELEISLQYKEILKGCLEINVEKRFTADQLLSLDYFKQ